MKLPGLLLLMRAYLNCFADSRVQYLSVSSSRRSALKSPHIESKMHQRHDQTGLSDGMDGVKDTIICTEWSVPYLVYLCSNDQVLFCYFYSIGFSHLGTTLSSPEYTSIPYSRFSAVTFDLCRSWIWNVANCFRSSRYEELCQ